MTIKDTGNRCDSFITNEKILSKELVLDARIIRLTNMEFYKELYLLKKTDCN